MKRILARALPPALLAFVVVACGGDDDEVVLADKRECALFAGKDTCTYFLTTTPPIGPTFGVTVQRATTIFALSRRVLEQTNARCEAIATALGVGRAGIVDPTPAQTKDACSRAAGAIRTATSGAMKVTLRTGACPAPTARTSCVEAREMSVPKCAPGEVEVTEASSDFELRAKAALDEHLAPLEDLAGAARVLALELSAIPGQLTGERSDRESACVASIASLLPPSVDELTATVEATAFVNNAISK